MPRRGRRTRRRGGSGHAQNHTGGYGCTMKGGGGRRQRGGMGLNGTVLSTALVPISLVLANQYWPGKVASTRRSASGSGTKRRRRRASK